MWLETYESTFYPNVFVYCKMEQKFQHNEKRERENKSKKAEERAKRTLYLVTITEITDPTVPFEDYISE